LKFGTILFADNQVIVAMNEENQQTPTHTIRLITMAIDCTLIMSTDKIKAMGFKGKYSVR
jgi:hypothetical protein